MCSRRGSTSELGYNSNVFILENEIPSHARRRGIVSICRSSRISVCRLGIMTEGRLIGRWGPERWRVVKRDRIVGSLTFISFGAIHISSSSIFLACSMLRVSAFFGT
jgi:hypothetical protein